ncbi:formate dehydrogenase subunit delta [Acidimangrovimonas sediminis]|uniref:formate dehydrogenase subunit delta n=1 Tax=Acidimangrovimonas sediminis TaxID=2056283 RepID=UPI000C802F3F|nr:formate dehydrogenase subunit delta [Acidimangrovimonas sediminis]
MSPDKLIRMANQIATFFASKPHDEGVAGVAAHISDFWEPRMRAQLFAAIEAGGEGLHPLVIEAAPHVRAVKAA